MVNDRIDRSTAFSMEEYQRLPEERLIEDPEIDPVPAQLGDQHTKLVQREIYQAAPELVDAVNLAIALGRPLLIQGEPGCGKTRLAYAVAYGLGLPLEISPIKSTSRAQDLLYTYDAVRRLYDAQFKPDAASPRSLDAREYIRLGPLGRAIARAQYGRRSVVLIDEIDKADLDFPNDLLWELDRLEFRIAESEQTYAVPDTKLRPIVLVTHNEEKALPSAFLRRCIFHYIAFPKQPNDLWRIMAAHQVAEEPLGRRAIDVLLRLREIRDLTKNPGISELLDWAGYLAEDVCMAIIQAGRLKRVALYYFHDLPAEGADDTILDDLADQIAPALDTILPRIMPLEDGYVYDDTLLLQPRPLRKVLDDDAAGANVVLLSDAGAARGRYDTLRLLDTLAFLKALRAHTPHVAWLNPLPRRYWDNSTAAAIARHVPMFPLDRAGVYHTVNLLRGQPNEVERPL